MSLPAHLDHIVIAAPDLEELIAWFAELTGVTAQPGGKHPTGTQNALVALTIDGQRGPQYIELIGPAVDREDQSKKPTAFGIDTLEAPAVQAYSVHPEDIDATSAAARELGWETGPVDGLSRKTPEGLLLEWRLTKGGPEGPKRLDVPFLIDWGTTPQPGETTEPAIEIVDFVRVEPSEESAAALRAELVALGDGVIDVQVGDRAGFTLKLRTADGEVIELH